MYIALHSLSSCRNLSVRNDSALWFWTGKSQSFWLHSGITGTGNRVYQSFYVNVCTCLYRFSVPNLMLLLELATHFCEVYSENNQLTHGYSNTTPFFES